MLEGAVLVVMDTQLAQISQSFLFAGQELASGVVGVMAFFNLTHLGPQDPFRAANITPWPSPTKPCTTQSDALTSNVEQPLPTEKCLTPVTSDQSSPDLQSDKAEHRDDQEQAARPKPMSHSEMYSTAKAEGAWHKDSHTKYTELLQKHQRNPEGPSDLYDHPLTTSHNYGWWMSVENPLKEDWTKGERRVYVNSEMTRFVDKMSVTNKDFSLY